ncbi:VRR-NUC domain-containing protein [Raineya sp.]
MQLSQVIADLSVELAKLKAEARNINEQKSQLQKRLEQKVAEYELRGDVYLSEEETNKNLSQKPLQLNLESIKPATSAETTKAIILYLNAFGCVAWRQNNAGVWDAKKQCYRKNQFSRRGIPDIVGYRKSDGKAIFVEVKSGKDRLSAEQKEFLREARENNCIAIVAKNFDDFEEQWKKNNYST